MYSNWLLILINTLDWTVILQDVMPIIIAGLFLSVAGYFIWKRQFKKQIHEQYNHKKLEVYAEFIPYVVLLKEYLEYSFDENKIYYEGPSFSPKDLDQTLILGEKFAVYFGDSYRHLLYELLGLREDYLREGEGYTANNKTYKIIDRCYNEFREARITIKL